LNKTIDKIQFKGGLPLEFEIIDVSKTYALKKGMMAKPHRAQFYHILWIDKGKGTHFVDFNPIEYTDNSIIFIPCNSVNKFDSEGIYTGKAILFTDSFFCKNSNDHKYLNSSILFSDLYPPAVIKHCLGECELSTLMNAMETEFIREADNAQYQILHNMLHIFLLQAEREMRKQGFLELKTGTNLDYLLVFKELLTKNFRTEKTVSKYASDINITEKQLHKATTTLLDKTPKQLIDEQIILEAKRLLVHSNQSIKEIAYELGYDEPTNFIKYFRKHNGCTPSEFRESY